jgi:hypothetical protein
MQTDGEEEGEEGPEGTPMDSPKATHRPAAGARASNLKAATGAASMMQVLAMRLPEDSLVRLDEVRAPYSTPAGARGMHSHPTRWHSTRTATGAHTLLPTSTGTYQCARIHL